MSHQDVDPTPGTSGSSPGNSVLLNDSWPFLRPGCHLRGKDILKVVDRLVALPTEADIPELASVSEKYPLVSYSGDELAREFEGLTGRPIQQILRYADYDDSLRNRRFAIHCAVIESNAQEPEHLTVATPAPAQEKGKGKAPKRSAQEVHIIIYFSYVYVCI